jgi:hypothetical protein
MSQPAHHSHVLHFTINATSFDTTDSDHEAAALLRLAGYDPASYDLFLVTEHGIEEVIRDDQIINLTDDSTFRARRKVHFTIDGEPHTTYDDDQTAADLLRLAGVDPSSFDLARIRPNGESHTEPDGTLLTLHDGDEFVTVKQVGAVA